MMKWKVVKQPRGNHDKSPDCSQPEVTQPKLPSNSDSNNNTTNDSTTKEAPPSSAKDKRQQDASSLCRQDSVVASECINLKGLLGLSRQRSETNVSSLGLVSSTTCSEPGRRQRSRSEARGSSRDRLSVGYHSLVGPTAACAPAPAAATGKTRSSSPAGRPGWLLRGRKRERENGSGKTVLAESGAESRTISDGPDDRVAAGKGAVSVSGHESSLAVRKSRTSSKSEVVYSEINHDVPYNKLPEKITATRDPTKVIKKKGMAPKPQVTSVVFRQEAIKENATTSNNNNAAKSKTTSPVDKSKATVLGDEPKTPPIPKPARKAPASKPIEAGVSRNNQKNSGNMYIKNRRSSCESNSLTTIAEVHKTPPVTNEDADKCGGAKNAATRKRDKSSSRPHSRSSSRPSSRHSTRHGHENKQNGSPKDTGSKTTRPHDEDTEEYHIDTPDYSTLNSEVDINEGKAEEQPPEHVENRPEADTSKCLEVDMTSVTSHQQPKQDQLDNKKSGANAPSSPVGDDRNSGSETKFDKIDLIEAYCKHQRDVPTPVQNSSAQVDLESLRKDPESVMKTSPRVVVDAPSEGPASKPAMPHPPMTVNVLVRNPSPANGQSPNDSDKRSGGHFMAKKSFVLTIAKQERGFQSLCKNRKLIPEEGEGDTNRTEHHQISVTFLCSAQHPATEPDSWTDCQSLSSLRLRSLSVPPDVVSAHDQQPDPDAAKTRSRSRDRRTKEKHGSKRSHKSKKKEAVFHMPQAVIDELSTVLEKRRPSLDGIAA